jgi:putative effector of murein hydrolase
MMGVWHGLGASLGVTPLFALVLTIGAYVVGAEIQRRIKNAIANPVLFAIIVVGIVLRLMHISYEQYFAGAQFLHFLLGPATVALAIPMVRTLEHIRKSLGPMLAALVAGAVVGAVSGYGIVRALGGSQVVAMSMMPKSLTTPIAMGVAQGVGGIPSLTAVLAIAGGILVAVCIDTTLERLKIEDWRAVGLSAGTAGSGIGASQVIPQHPIAAAFAGVALGANGLITATLAPVLAPLLRHW